MTYAEQVLEKIETIKQRARERLERYREILESGGTPVFDTTIFGGMVTTPGQAWVSDELEAYLSSVETAFTQLTNGSASGTRPGRPERMMELIERINDDSFALLTEAKNDDIPRVRADVADWTGIAGTAFLEYLDDWETKAEYQREYLQEIGRVLQALQRVLSRQQRAAIRIADACIQALENPGQEHGGGGGDETGLFFTVVGAVAAVAGAPAVVGAGISLASGLTSYMDAKRGGDDRRDEFPMNSMYVDELLSDTLAAIDTVWERVAGELDEVQGVAQQYYDEYKGDGVWVLQLGRPQSADSGDWVPPPAQGEALALELAQAYMAGQHRIPAASWYYREARARLSGAMVLIESTIGADPFGYYTSRFSTVQDIVEQLKSVFENTATDLTDTAANLVTAVDEYVATDASIAAVFDAKRDEFENVFEEPTGREGSAAYEDPDAPAVVRPPRVDEPRMR